MPHVSRRFLLATAGFGLAGGLAEAASPTQKPLPPTGIGVAMPLTGAFALIGDECRRGIQLAADAVNAAGGIAGRPVTLSVADVIDQDHTAGAVNSLITKSHAGLVLGTGASGFSYPGTAAAELAQIPYIELTAPAAGITARGFKYLLRTGPTTTMIGNLAAATLKSRYQGRKIAILFNTGATSGAIAAAVIAAMSAAKLPVLLVQGYPEETVDLFGPVGRLKRAGAQIVLHAAGPVDALGFFAAMQEQSWRPEAVIGCGDGYPLYETAYALGSAFDGTFVIAAPGTAAAVAAAYAARYGAPPRSPDSLTTYAGAKLVFDTLNTIGGDPTRLLDALRQTNIPVGGLANGFGAAFDHTGQNTRSFVTLQQWRGQVLTAVS
jgi:branched-chain amino acid transport system substrate-binding protein